MLRSAQHDKRRAQNDNIRQFFISLLKQSVEIIRRMLFKPRVESGNLLAGFFDASGTVNDEVGAPELFLDE